jgi:undecaprenyl-diphosphatase
LPAVRAAFLIRPVMSRVQAWWREAGWDGFVRVMAASTFLAAVLFFVVLARNAPKGTYVPLELQLMRAMRRDGEPLGPWWFAESVRDATALGSASVLVLMTALILGYLCLCRRYRIALLIAAATAGGEILNTVLKNAFERARPEATLHIVKVTSTSFPSGHAMAASIFYLTVGALLARMAKRRREKTYLMMTALLLTGITAFSRVYLGVHYPTDVLAGWSAGTAWALLCWFVADWLARRGALRAETGEQASA